MKKIIVLGNSGSGKSTLSKEISSFYNLPLLYLDTIVYKHDWEEDELKNIESTINDFINQENWLVDGNFLKKGTARFVKCNTIIFLDINRFTCFFSVLRRYFKYKNKHRESRSDLCNEKLSFAYLKWVFWDFYKTSRKKILTMCRNTHDKEVIILKSRRKVKRYLKSLTMEE